MSRVLGGSMEWRGYDSDDNLVVTLSSATDSGLNAEVQKVDVRGGMEHKKYANFYYGASLTATSTSALFNLSYFEQKFGSSITMGSKIQTTEEVTVTVENTITVTGTPVSAPSRTSINGTYKLASSNSEVEDAITFVGQDATVSGLEVGTVVCVTYWVTDITAKNLVIPTSMIPNILYFVGVANEFDAGEEDGTVSNSSSLVGKFQAVVPRGQLDASADISMSSSGVASTPVGFEALANKDSGCAGQEYYAIWSETTIGAEALDTCTGLGAINGDIELSVGNSQTINVVGTFSGTTGLSAIDNQYLTFTSLTPATATVGANTGIVTAVAEGTSIIEITATTNAEVSTVVVVTVVS